MTSEASLERRCAVYVQKQGGVLLKILGSQGWPDRCCLLPNGKMFMVEFKREGGQLSPIQRAIKAQLEAMHFAVYEVDNRHLFERLVQERLL